MRLLLSLLLVLCLSPLAGLTGCASQQLKFDSLNKRDKLRYAACRHDVSRHICPDDPDCDVKSAELYAAEPPDSRRRWLIDYGCSPEKIQHADDSVRKQERESIGME